MKLFIAALMAIVSAPAMAGGGGILFTSGGGVPPAINTDTITLSLSAAANPGTYPYSPLMIFGNGNTYLQEVIQNLSNGTNASGDLVLTNDLGADASFYLDIGINSSKFSQAGQSVEASSSTFVASSDSDLILWADTNGGANGGLGHVIIGSSNPVSGNTAVNISSVATAFYGSTFTISRGLYSAPSQPCVHFHSSIGQNVAASVAVPLMVDTVDSGTGIYINASSSGTFTVLATGNYQINASATFHPTTSGYVALYVDAPSYGETATVTTAASATLNISLAVSDMLYITAGNTIIVNLYQTGAGAFTTFSGDSITMCKLN